MFRKLLNPDNALMITMTQITDCIFLSLFFLVGCFPVITAGASFAALYDATFRGFRQGDKHCWQRFGQVYKDNWKASVAPTVVFLLAASVLSKALIGRKHLLDAVFRRRFRGSADPWNPEPYVSCAVPV